MEVKITILVENTTPTAPITGEYGFAAMVSVNESQYLFDTGSAGAVFSNAKILGVDLQAINCLIISHGHFDHTGGVVPFLQTGRKKVYAHKDVFTKRFVVSGTRKKDISARFCLEDIEKYRAELNLIDQFTKIDEGIFLTGTVPRINDFEDVGGAFKAEKDGQLVDDVLPDDMSLVIDHPEGLIIISGCAHAGMINIIDFARQQTGRDKVQAFIGGTHLFTASEDRVAKTIARLKEYNINRIIPCHCTGFYASARLYNELGRKVIKGETSMSFKF